MVGVTSDCPSSSNQTALALQCELGEGAHISVKLSHPPTRTTLDLYENLASNIVGCHVDLFPWPSSPRSVDPLDCTMLCSPISNSLLVVHNDQVSYRVGVDQPTCAIIYDEYVWESKE